MSESATGPAKVCPKCSGNLTDHAPDGMCPRCLLSVGLAEPSCPVPVGVAHVTDEEGMLPAAAADAASQSESVPAVTGSLRYVGNYELLEEVARGGMGVVYKARQLRPNRVVALKMILAGPFASEAEVRRFTAEAESAGRLDHPAIVPVYEVGRHNGLHYFSMGYVDGPSLAARLLNGPLPPPEAAALIRTVALAVDYAHQHGIIHRDLKPGNILLDRDGRPRITDFGLARLTEHTSDLTGPGQVLGTPGYMPPEQATGGINATGPASDVYSLGATLYCAVTGRPPFQAATAAETLIQLQNQEPVPPRQLNANVPQDLDTIVLKCLERVPARRYPSARELADDLGRLLEGLPVTARPPSAAYRLGKLVRRHKGSFAAAALVATSLIVAIVVLAVSNASIRKEQVRTRAEQTRAAAAQRLAEQRADEMRRSVEDLQAANQLLERGRFFADQQRWDDAEAAFTRAIELRPEYATLWSDRGELYRRLGLFELAVRDFDRAFRLQTPERSWFWRFHALLLWNARDREGYRDIARRMRMTYEGTSNRTLAIEVIAVSALDPAYDAAATHDIELASEVVATDPQNPWFHYALGVVLYRAGQFESAAQELNTSLELQVDWAARGIAYPVLAMVHHRLGRPEQAREALQAAGRALDEWTRQRYEARGNWAVHFGAVGEWPILWWDWLECQLYYQEASLLISGAPPPEDPHLRVLRARALAGLRRTAGALAEFDAAVELRPDDPKIRCETHRARGYYFGYRDWPLAANEFGLARALAPTDHNLRNLEAISQLAAGHPDGYRETCSQMLREFAATDDPSAANDVVFACVLLPGAVPDPEQLLRLARVAARLHPGNDRVLGAACFRAGDYNQAVQCLENSAHYFRPRAWEWCFRAMAHHRRGDAAEARRCLDEARRWIDEANRQETLDLTERKRLWDGFTERFEFPLLCREAETLILGNEQLRTAKSASK